LVSLRRNRCFVIPLFLNRQGAKDAKGFISEPPRCEGREGFLLVFLIGTDDQENNHALRAAIVSDCLPCVLCRPSSMVHSSSGGIRV